MRRPARACLAVTLLLAACSGYELELDGLAIDAEERAIFVGDTLRMSVTRRDGTIPLDHEVAWSSSHEAVATVDEVGLVTGRGPGWVQIHARTAEFAVEMVLRVWVPAGPFTSVAAGVSHTCGLTEDGRGWCWGLNDHGQLGRGAPDTCVYYGGVVLPCAGGAVPVATDERFTSLAVGYYHTCGLTDAGAVWCWGLNDRGQLGDGSTTTRVAPAPVAGEARFRELAAAGRSTCGIDEGGRLLCWGGTPLAPAGTPEGSLTAPTPIAEEQEFHGVALAPDHTCGHGSMGSTLCWGLNDSGQLGVGGVDSTSVPQAVEGAPPFTALVADRGFTCGLAVSGAAYCWGGNDSGQLGDGTLDDRSEAAAVAGGHTFTRLSAGPDRACGLDGGGLLFCWGRDDNGFGTGVRLVETSVPVRAAPELAFTTFDVGSDHACGVAETGVTWCWGGSVAIGNGRTNWLPRRPDDRWRHDPATPARVVLRADGS